MANHVHPSTKRPSTSRQIIIKRFAACFVLALHFLASPLIQASDDRPNILFAIADDWGWPHAGAYGDPVVKTPTFDRVAAGGLLFTNAYVSSPSCTPSRNAILTGQYHWRLGWGANLWSKLDTKHQTFPNLLEDAGYFTGFYRKSWGPGRLDNWKDHPNKHPVGQQFKSVDKFFEALPDDRPFCFWFGSSDPHRGYKVGSGVESGMDIQDIQMFKHYPDSDTIRSDIADYYFEVQRFDRELGEVLDKLAALGKLENTIVVVTGDHGMPFPRCKGNLYDSGVRVPMAVMGPNVRGSKREISDFVSTTDLAPTLLEAAGVTVPDAMTGKSWSTILDSSNSGRIDENRDHVFVGKERHVPCQEAPDFGGTPMRAIRTDDYLFIRNFEPDRWPAGTPDFENATIKGVWFGDVDNGPTKTYMLDNQDLDDEHRRSYALAFAKRPEFELYDLTSDPDQINNVADNSDYADILAVLAARLTKELARTDDPRILGHGKEVFDTPKYFGRGPRHPSTEK